MRQNADVMHGKPTSHNTDPNTFGIAYQAENISMILASNLSVWLFDILIFLGTQNSVISD